MLAMFVRLQSHLDHRLRSFAGEERGGERDTLTTLLILALIIVPIVVILIGFGEQIMDKAQEAWDSMFG